MDKLKRGTKILKNWWKMRHLVRFVCDKENSSSLLMVYFENDGVMSP